jgi:predicted amidohydrolase
MSLLRLALATLPYPDSRDDSLRRATAAINEAGSAGADLLVLPECYVPGYRRPGRNVAPPDTIWLNAAWQELARHAATSRVAVVVATERVSTSGQPIPTAVVIDASGRVLGMQDKVQIPPEEEDIYGGGADRRVFVLGGVTLGVVICHEGWRYPETVRWAARHGAQLVVHPHYSWAEPGAHVPRVFAEPANSFHEKAALCRAAENTVWFATVNYAEHHAPTTSAIIDPDGAVLAWQPYGQEGLLFGDIDVERGTGFLAKRLRALSDA